MWGEEKILPSKYSEVSQMIYSWFLQVNLSNKRRRHCRERFKARLKNAITKGNFLSKLGGLEIIPSANPLRRTSKTQIKSINCISKIYFAIIFRRISSNSGWWWRRKRLIEWTSPWRNCFQWFRNLRCACQSSTAFEHASKLCAKKSIINSMSSSFT